MRPQTVRPAIDFILLKAHRLANQHDVAPILSAHQQDVLVGIVRPTAQKLAEVRMSSHYPFQQMRICLKEMRRTYTKATRKQNLTPLA